MSKIKVNFNNTTGKIKPVHGVGQPPFKGIDFSYIKYLKDAGIPYSRLHDVGGGYGANRYVDIPNLFRDFSADPYDENSYDFAFTDLLITALIENNVEPVFRLGVTIENFVAVKAYRIFPPEDYNKWAVICEHIIRHYTEGWANGFNYKITYWEIWNEPDNYEDPMENQMWRGTKEQFYELYNVASKHLKKKFPHLKIGGYASCGFYSITGGFSWEAKSSPRLEYFIEFFDGFLDYIKKNNCPLDFFSWHSYGSIKDNEKYSKYARKRLDEAGFVNTETSCNEWNYEAKAMGTYYHAALCCSMLLMFQNSPLENAMFYDARIGLGTYSGLFHAMTTKPYPAYYAFKTFNRLYELENQAELMCDNGEIYAVAAVNGNKGAIVIANPTENEITLNIEMSGTITDCRITVEGKIEESIPLPNTLPKHSFILINTNLSNT